MPEICRFYGIVIRINFREHLPPHFHAEYGDEMAIIDIRTLAVFEGRLPPKAMGLVAEWASLHQGELQQAWERAQQHQNPGKIDPLR